ncbi:ATP synthase E chain-domain-containing protein [Diplogelasinospora grovesii]|uniref:ATP synthase F(0) complex subunit e, mitochondrial n=1 Tax=Diplogelasinospora grovesii TaxID=303347 RepID=A0AAN6NBT0_9PEZI|nr:ATP synthase E chain-domain-containing protein [Diplogelasinospora grovesii]
MSSASGVNVLRYSALGLGIFYGFYHQRKINSSQKALAEKREYEHKQELIQKAKEAYAKSKQPGAASSTSGGLNQDPMDPKFDLEAYLNALMKENP